MFKFAVGTVTTKSRPLTYLEIILGDHNTIISKIVLMLSSNYIIANIPAQL